MVDEYIWSNDEERSIELLNDLVKKKTNPRWYLWVLVSSEATDLSQKLLMIKKTLGNFPKLTKYHVYMLKKGEILDEETILKLQGTES